MDTLVLNFNKALNSIKKFAETIFTGEDKNQKLSNLCNASINELPPEMLEKILKLLSNKEIYQTQLVCRRWNEIIVKGILVKRAKGKIST